MSFRTDKQTLTDLNITGKYKAGSLFNLFNRVRTKGGERLLEELFRTPLTEAAPINHRAVSIQYIQQLDLTLEIDNEATEKASRYLTDGRPMGRLSSLLDCWKHKMQQLLYQSDQFRFHQQQIRAVQEVLMSAGKLLSQLISRGLDTNPIGDKQNQLQDILDALRIAGPTPDGPYSVWRTAGYQYLFRNKYRSQLQNLLRILYELDVYISVAQAAKSRGLTYANALTPAQPDILLSAKDLRHPVLPDAIGNDIILGAEHHLLFLTGANRAGKSTWMKTLGVSFYLAHMGFPVAARSMSFRVMDGLFTSINVADDITAGWSHFYAEVMRVKTVARELSEGRRLFVLFDELFKGTNVKDAYDATLAVTQKLAGYKACAFVISTHIFEVAAALSVTPHILFQYMPTVMHDAVPRYTYRLAAGTTSDRQGMIILQNERILQLLE